MAEVLGTVRNAGDSIGKDEGENQEEKGTHARAGRFARPVPRMIPAAC
jgi:hypothetical protein